MFRKLASTSKGFSYCGLVIPYGDTDLRQYWLQFTVAWRNQAITWTYIKFSLVRNARDNAVPSAKYACFCWWTQKIWMISLITMFVVRPICVQDSIFKMAGASPGWGSVAITWEDFIASAQAKIEYHQTSNIRHILVGNKIVDHSDVVGASPVGAAPTTSSFPT